MYNGKVSTTFAPAEISTFALNGWFMHTQSQLYRISTSESHDNCTCTMIIIIIIIMCIV